MLAALMVLQISFIFTFAYIITLSIYLSLYSRSGNFIHSYNLTISQSHLGTKVSTSVLPRYTATNRQRTLITPPVPHSISTNQSSTQLWKSPLNKTATMPVGPRVSKEEFMHALGLNPQDPHHEQYYRAMRVSNILYPIRSIQFNTPRTKQSWSTTA